MPNPNSTTSSIGMELFPNLLARYNPLVPSLKYSETAEGFNPFPWSFFFTSPPRKP